MSSGKTSSSSSDDGLCPALRPVRIKPGKSETVIMNEACFSNLWDHLGGEVTLSETKRYYDIKAGRYDEEMVEQCYKGPKIILDKLISLRMGTNSRILDIGCGTGLLGVALHGAGYSQILGIDMSSEMMRVCQKKKIYTQLDRIVVNPETNFGPLKTFDAVCLLSSLQPGHVSPACLENLATVLNPKGYLIWARSSEIPLTHFTSSFKQARWTELKKKLESKGVRCLEETRISDFLKNKPGVIGVFRRDR